MSHRQGTDPIWIKHLVGIPSLFTQQNATTTGIVMALLLVPLILKILMESWDLGGQNLFFFLNLKGGQNLHQFFIISAWGQAEAKGGRNVRTPCLGRLLHGPWAVKGEGFAEDYKVNRDCSGEDINYQKENMFIFLLKSLPPLLFFV